MIASTTDTDTLRRPLVKSSSTSIGLLKTPWTCAYIFALTSTPSLNFHMCQLLVGWGAQVLRMLRIVRSLYNRLDEIRCRQTPKRSPYRWLCTDLWNQHHLYWTNMCGFYKGCFKVFLHLILNHECTNVRRISKLLAAARLRVPFRLASVVPVNYS